MQARSILQATLEGLAKVGGSTPKKGREKKVLQARMKVFSVEGPKAMLVKANDGKMLEIADALLLRTIIPGAAGLLRLSRTPKALKPLSKLDDYDHRSQDERRAIGKKAVTACIGVAASGK
ncbi:hypothetical protein ACLOJK_017760 [Asimina triloba]